MIDVLEKVRLTNELCEIYFNRDDANDYEVGYIVNLSDVHFLMERVTSSGEHGGFLLGFVEDVFAVITRSQYITKLQTLMQARFAPKTSPVEGGNILEETLFYAQSAAKLCAFSVLGKGNTDYGFVGGVAGRTVAFLLVDGYGEPDGECVVLKDDLAALSFGGETERRLEELAGRVNR